MIAIKRLLLKCQSNAFLKENRKYISVLYTAGDKAKENYLPVMPYMDFNKLLRDTKCLEESLNHRGMKVDVNDLIKKYKVYDNLDKSVEDIEGERAVIAQKMKNLSAHQSSEDDISALKEQGRTLRNKLKTLKEKLYPIEEDFIHAFLNLPNDLHDKCPRRTSDKLLLYRNGVPSKALNEISSHLNRTDLIKFKDNSCYYLLNEAAEFDLKCMQVCVKYFVANDFIQSSNPDFVRRVILEASTTPNTDYHLVKEKQLQNQFNASFLAGGGAFESFLGYMAKLSVYPSILPLRLTSSGRRYKIMHDPQKVGLYAATQSNVVQTFVASEDDKSADVHMEEILNLAINFYKTLGINFRIVYSSASEMTPAESLRAAIEVYSPVTSKYIEVGNVSNYKDFISKRILFNIKEQKEYKFPHIVGGPIVHVTPLIAALIENDVQLDSIKFVDLTSNKIPTDEFKNLFT